MLRDLKKILNTIGLAPKEADVLYILLQHNGLRVRDIARKAHLNRTTAYGIIKTLQVKGLLTSLTRYGITEYQSLEPALLPTFIERQEEALREHKREINRLIPQIEKIRDQKNILPKIYFFEGLEGLKQAYEDTLENNPEKVIRDITGLDAMFDQMGMKQFVDYYVAKRAARGIKSLSIFPDTKWSRWLQQNDKKFLRVTKLIPKKYAFDSELVVYGDRVAIFSISVEKPMAVIIENENISNALKKIFEYIDDLTPASAVEKN